MCSNWYGMKRWARNLYPLCLKLSIPYQHLHRMSIHTSHPSNISIPKIVVVPFHPRNKSKKISLSSLAAKYARIYEYQKLSQISKITVRRCLLFKCHCSEIYFVFSQKSLFLWHIHNWQDSVSSDIWSASTILKCILATESLIISLINTVTYSPLKRVSLWWNTLYHSKTYLSNSKSLS